MAISKADTEAITRGIAAGLKPHLEEIYRRLAAIEASGPKSFADAYAGTWKEGAFKAGTMVTHSGSLWIAHADTEDRPGTSPHWQLMVKSR